MTVKTIHEIPREADLAAKARERKATQAYRDGLVLGLPMDWIRDSLVRSGECSREVADRLLDEVRNELKERTMIYRDLEVATTLERLETLYSLNMQKGDFRNALEVVRERARFTRAADFVKFTSCEEKRAEKPSELQKAITDLGPVGRERAAFFLKGIVGEAIEMAKRAEAGRRGQEQEGTRMPEDQGTTPKSDLGSGSST